MQLPQAYRSLARPSSALEPSYSPGGIVATSVGYTYPDDTDPVDVWIARTHGRHRAPPAVVGDDIEPFPTSLSRDGAYVLADAMSAVLTDSDSNREHLEEVRCLLGLPREREV